MAKMQSFVVNSEVTPKVQLKGQAARVMEELLANPVPRTGPEIDDAIRTSERPHSGRQDSLRVTLYYLVVFKGKGWVTATRPATEVSTSATDALYEMAGI